MIEQRTILEADDLQRCSDDDEPLAALLLGTSLETEWETPFKITFLTVLIQS